MDDSLQENMMIRLPVKFGYQALESVLQKKLKGEPIETEKKGKVTRYATILDVAVAKSLENGFDLAIDLKFKTLTSLFRNKEGSILLDVAMEFNHGEQQVYIKDYTLKVDSNSWLMNRSLEVVANNFVYDKIKNKMKFDFRPLIKKHLLSFNRKMEDSLEISEGIYIKGCLMDFSVVDVMPGDDFLLIPVEIEASTLVDIKKVDL